jgi:DinB superfamily
MAEQTLAQAVEQFAHATYALTEADLARDWTWGAYDEGLRYAFFRTYEELRELAAVTVAERATHGPAISAPQRALAQHQAAYRDLQALLIGLPDAELDHAPAAGEWPLRTVLEHIIQAEGGFYVLIRYAIERKRSGDGRPAEIPESFWEQVVGPEEPRFKAALAGPLAEIWGY